MWVGVGEEEEVGIGFGFFEFLDELGRLFSDLLKGRQFH